MLRRIRALWRNLRHGSTLDRDLDAELRSCVELLTDQKVREGVPHDEAQYRARLELGGVELAKEQVRDVRFGSTLEALWRDTRFAGRTLRRHPSFTAVAALTLGMGLGANIAIFGLLDAVLFRFLAGRSAATTRSARP